MVAVFRTLYNASHTLVAMPVKSLESHYTILMIKLNIITGTVISFLYFAEGLTQS